MKEIIVANLGAFMELLMIQLYFGLVWGERIVFRKFSIFLFLWNAVMVTCVSFNLLPGFVVLSSYIWIVIYVHFHYPRKYKENIVKFIILIIISAMTEVVTLFVMNLISFNIQTDQMGYLITCFLNLILTIAVCFVGNKKKIFSGLNGFYDKIIWILCLTVFVVLFILLDIFYSHKVRIGYVLFILIVLGLYLTYMYKYQKMKYELIQKEFEDNINNFYGTVYEDLLADVRRRQHDYKNHIAAIYNSHKCADSLEKLIEIQTQYIENVSEDGKFDIILTKCSDPVIAGFLYHKASYCENNNIEIDFELNYAGVNCSIRNHELVEILGNFLDNSIEYVSSHSCKVIKVKLYEDEHEIKVSVSNPSEFFEQKRINEIFSLGNTSKGRGRGVGLSRVSQICKNNNLDIQVENVMNEDDIINFGNWIKFTVIIPKMKEEAL